MEIAGLDHLGIITESLDESCRFYCEHLGFTAGERRSEPSLKLRFGYVHRDGTTLELLEPDEKGAAREGFAHLALRCRDIHGLHRALGERGVTLLHKEVQRAEGLEYFFIKAPNGVLIEFVERGG